MNNRRFVDCAIVILIVRKKRSESQKNRPLEYYKMRIDCSFGRHVTFEQFALSNKIP